MSKIEKIEEIKTINQFIKNENQKKSLNNKKNNFDEILQKEIEKLKVKKSEN